MPWEKQQHCLDKHELAARYVTKACSFSCSLAVNKNQTTTNGPNPLSGTVIQQWNKTYTWYGSRQTFASLSYSVLCLMRVAMVDSYKKTQYTVQWWCQNLSVIWQCLLVDLMMNMLMTSPFFEHYLQMKRTISWWKRFGGGFFLTCEDFGRMYNQLAQAKDCVIITYIS